MIFLEINEDLGNVAYYYYIRRRLVGAVSNPALGSHRTALTLPKLVYKQPSLVTCMRVC